MRGDLLFYPPKDALGTLIARSTHGRFCHVAIDNGDGTNIAADWSGVGIYPNSAREAVRAPLPGSAKVENGFTFLKQQVGLKYGLLDVIDIGARLLFRFSFYVARPRSYDCSDLATRYLNECGLEDWLGPLAQEPHLVTPNDLAHRFGLY